MRMQGESCFLVPLDNMHADTFAHFLGNVNFRHTFTGSLPLRPIDVAAQWDKERAAGDLLWGVFTEGMRFIGTTGLHQHRDIYRSWEFRILLGHPDSLGKGIGTEVTRMVVDWAFKRLNAHRVWLGVSAANTGAIKCYEKVGFKKDGALRDAIFCNGGYVDALQYSILEDEWPNTKR